MSSTPSTSFVLRALAGILITFFLPHFGLIPIPFGYAVVVLLILWLLLKKDRQDFADLGFSRKRWELKAAWLGIVVAILLFAFLNYAFFPLLYKLTHLEKANLKDFSSIRHSPANYVFILVMGWLVGGIYEEIVFHGYIFTRLERLIPGKYGLTLAFLATNLIFSLYHVQLGVSGMLNAFLAGSVYHGLMLRHRRNMWYAVVCHGFFDTIGLTFLFLGYW
ncbi:MAG TPA: CPBP family intramembrane glutamic endopeptidase [Puia sp.]|nr:CPBP family intramembrane glutamic endopeptidase [Puia sp.]